jgi:hypothetical protein
MNLFKEAMAMKCLVMIPFKKKECRWSVKQRVKSHSDEAMKRLTLLKSSNDESFNASLPCFIALSSFTL